MKNNFAKKTIKILTAAIFSIFVLATINVEIIKAANFQSSSSSINSAFMQGVSSESSNASNKNVENNNPYTNTGESTTGFEQPSASNDENNNGIDDALEIDNPANFQTMDNKNQLKDGGSGGKFIFTLLQPLPREGDDLKTNVTLKEYLTWAFRFVLALAGFLAVMMIVIGGVEYIISGASEAMRGEAKKRIENAIWGLVLALVSYLVLYTINPSLVNFEDNCFFKDCGEETTTPSRTTTQTQPLPTNSGNTQTPILQPAPVLLVPPPTISPTIPTGGTSGKTIPSEN